MNTKTKIFLPQYEGQKGCNSTVLIIGGSDLYTGAPYFAGLSAFKSGFDLCYIMCEKEALIPLKVLLPEAIITHIQCMKWILDRINICIIGPGLGRPNIDTIEIIKQIYIYLKVKNIFFIFDGDGIKLYMDQFILQDYSKIIFTPNYNEKFKIKNSEKYYIIEKGRIDQIRMDGKVYKIDDDGCEKRISGQGDILCGILSYLIVKNDNVLDCMMAACKVMRKASNIAYIKKGRTLMAKDIIQEIGNAFMCLTDEK